MWPFGRKKTTPPAIVRLQRRPDIRGRYDAAQTTDANRKQWMMVDPYSADVANNHLVRRTLRMRCRYEVANNSYARGIVLTLANDAIGTGPRLQLKPPANTAKGTGKDDLTTTVERAFAKWCDAVRLDEKLRTMRMAKVQDGEAFALLVNNPKLPVPVKLDIRLIEADQVASPVPLSFPPYAPDGIVLDDYGNVEYYKLLRAHPGGRNPIAAVEFDLIPPRYMLHWFRVDRPGQHRGLPELMPALDLFSQLRRFTMAVLDAAELAADFAGILYTDAPANGEADAVEPMDTIELERRMFTTMPGGWKLGQMDAKQPATTYPDFKCEILKEIARCLEIPYNVAAGDSSGYNYSSGRLDHQTYFKAIRREQHHLENAVLDRIFAEWLAEAVQVMPEIRPILSLSATGPTDTNINPTDIVRPQLPNPNDQIPVPDHSWFWDGNEHVDPSKEADAQAVRLLNHTTTYAHEFGRQGLDWETELRQAAKEKELIDELGLAPPPPPKADPGDGEGDESDKPPAKGKPAAKPAKKGSNASAD